MISCVRKIHFCYAHRVKGHESKCASLHGHNAIVWAHAKAEGLDDLGRIVDFSVLKEKLGGWVDTYWDHNTVVFGEDQELVSALSEVKSPKKPFVLNANPTAENMASYLLHEVAPKVLAGAEFSYKNCFGKQKTVSLGKEEANIWVFQCVFFEKITFPLTKTTLKSKFFYLCISSIHHLNPGVL